MKTKNVSSSGVQVLTHLRPDVRLHDLVAHVQHDGLERAHEARRHRPAGLQEPPHDGRHDEEHDGRDEPQHEDMLGDRQVDAGDGRKMNQRVIERAVGDVIDDGLAGVEAFGCRVTAAM